MSFLSALIKPLAYISVPVILIRALANSSSAPARYYARVVIYVGTLIAVGSCSFFVAVGMTLMGRQDDVDGVVAFLFYNLVSPILDLKVEVEGAEHLDGAQPAVLMSNHQSLIDVLVLGKLMPWKTVMVAKKSLQYSPLGPFMTLSGTVFVDRGNSARAVRSLEAAVARMKRDKTSVWIFPEGTRHSSNQPDMLPLKKGGFHIAVNAGIPIVPIVTENYWHIYHKHFFNSGTIKVRVLPPVPTTGLAVADVGDLATRVRSQMVETLRQLASERGLASNPETVKAPHQHQEPQSDEMVPSKVSEPAPASPALDISGPSDSLEGLGGISGSSISLASSGSSTGRVLGSETGGETEEDEGMILVGRPN